VNVSTAGTYDFNVRVASPNYFKKLHIEMNGINVTSSITVPQTGGWYTWTTVKVSGIALNAGTQVMRVYMETDGFNINYIDITKSPIARLDMHVSSDIASVGFASFPNPTHGLLMVVNDNITEKEISISISNIIGQEMFNETYINTEPNFEKLLDINHLQTGVYVLRVYSGGKIWTNKIMKQ
jgi:hypothetical protein